MNQVIGSQEALHNASISRNSKTIGNNVIYPCLPEKMLSSYLNDSFLMFQLILFSVICFPSNYPSSSFFLFLSSPSFYLQHWCMHWFLAMWQPLSRGCTPAGLSTTPGPKTSRISYVSIIFHKASSSECSSTFRQLGRSTMELTAMRYNTEADSLISLIKSFLLQNQRKVLENCTFSCRFLYVLACKGRTLEFHLVNLNLLFTETENSWTIYSRPRNFLNIL